MIIESSAIPEVKIIKPRRLDDDRGFFAETYNQRVLTEAGIAVTFVQDNHTFSAARGTVRGLHFQVPPFAQNKLVRVVRGAAFDIAVDIRVGSPTFGRHTAALISASNWNQVFVPVGFAHGLMSLEPDTEVIYKVSNFYSPAHDKGLLWSDPTLEIDWPVPDARAIVSRKDRGLPCLADLPTYFHYEPRECR